MSEDAPLLPRTTEDAHGDEHVPQREKYRLKTGENLESQRAHKIIIALILIDAVIVITDLAYVFLNQTCSRNGGAAEPELPTWLEILAHVSEGITTLFLLEIPLALWAFGTDYYNPRSDTYPHPGFHLFDAIVIIGTFIVDVGLRGRDRELASLLIVFRLWRIVKVVGGVAVGVSEYNEAAAKELKEAQETITKMADHIKELEEENKKLRSTAQEQ